MPDRSPPWPPIIEPVEEPVNWPGRPIPRPAVPVPVAVPDPNPPDGVDESDPTGDGPSDDPCPPRPNAEEGSDPVAPGTEPDPSPMPVLFSAPKRAGFEPEFPREPAFRELDGQTKSSGEPSSRLPGLEPAPALRPPSRDDGHAPDAAKSPAVAGSSGGKTAEAWFRLLPCESVAEVEGQPVRGFEVAETTRGISSGVVPSQVVRSS